MSNRRAGQQLHLLSLKFLFFPVCPILLLEMYVQFAYTDTIQMLKYKG